MPYHASTRPPEPSGRAPASLSLSLAFQDAAIPPDRCWIVCPQSQSQEFAAAPKLLEKTEGCTQLSLLLVSLQHLHLHLHLSLVAPPSCPDPSQFQILVY